MKNRCFHRNKGITNGTKILIYNSCKCKQISRYQYQLLQSSCLRTDEKPVKDHIYLQIVT